MQSRADDIQAADPRPAPGQRWNTLPMSAMRRERGFSLIELMIAVAIVGILAAIAYPAYQDQVQKSRRGQAKADLTELAQILERNFTEANRYDQTSAGGALRDGANVPLAPLFSTSPRTGTPYYNITLPTLMASTFTLNAAPTGVQAGDPCGTYTLTQAGTKGVTGGTLTAADCW